MLCPALPQEAEAKPETQVDGPPKKKASQLHSKVQSLLELICDIKAMEECVLEMKFDIKKAPLGVFGVTQLLVSGAGGWVSE